MGCWIKKYKKGFAWFCNTQWKRVSPIYPTRAHAFSASKNAPRHEYFQEFKDARLVIKWPKVKDVVVEDHDTLLDFYAGYLDDSSW